MGERAPELFAELRQASIERLVEVREALDESYAAVPADAARERFEVLLDRFHAYLVDGDAERQRRFIRRYLALRLGEGRSPESIMHALVTVCDVLVQTARHELLPDNATLDLVCALQRMNYVTARSVSDVLAEDHQRKVVKAAELSSPPGEGSA